MCNSISFLSCVCMYVYICILLAMVLSLSWLFKLCLPLWYHRLIILSDFFFGVHIDLSNVSQSHKVSIWQKYNVIWELQWNNEFEKMPTFMFPHVSPTNSFTIRKILFVLVDYTFYRSKFWKLKNLLFFRNCLRICFGGLFKKRFWKTNFVLLADASKKVVVRDTSIVMFN